MNLKTILALSIALTFHEASNIRRLWIRLLCCSAKANGVDRILRCKKRKCNAIIMPYLLLKRRFASLPEAVGPIESGTCSRGNEAAERVLTEEGRMPHSD